VTLQQPRLHRTAIFVDYDNLKGSNDRPLAPGEIIDAIRGDLGVEHVVQFTNVYWAMGLPDDPSPVDRNKIYQLYSKGANPIPVPSFRGSGMERVKNITDSSAIVDIIESLLSHPEIEAYCIATGDKDFVPAVRKLRSYGKLVRIYYRDECAKVLEAEVEWVRGDGFSSTVDLEKHGRTSVSDNVESSRVEAALSGR